MMPSSDVTIIIIDVHLIWKYEENKKEIMKIKITSFYF